MQVEKLFWYLSWLFDCLQELKLPTTALAAGPELPFVAAWGGTLYGLPGWFLFNKHSSLKLRKFHDCQWIARFGCTDLTQATAHSFIVLVNFRIQKSITMDNNLIYFVKCKRDISVKVHPLQSCPKNKNDPFYLISNKKLRLNGKHQGYTLWIKTESIRKWSNFNFQGTKILYQNNLNNIAFLFIFFKGYRCN